MQAMQIKYPTSRGRHLPVGPEIAAVARTCRLHLAHAAMPDAVAALGYASCSPTSHSQPHMEKQQQQQQQPCRTAEQLATSSKRPGGARKDRASDTSNAIAERPAVETPAGRLLMPNRRVRDGLRRGHGRNDGTRNGGGGNGIGSSSRGGGGAEERKQVHSIADGAQNDVEGHGYGYGNEEGGSAVFGGGEEEGAFGGGGGSGEGPLQSSLAEELRELERLYGSADRTRSSYRTRQKWLDRRAAEREAVYGVRHRDADVRLLALRRYLAATGRLRRRGRFAVNDAMPRASTWHKLPPPTQRQILDERAAVLQAELGLPAAAGRWLYLAAPGLLTDISYGVAARLRALAARLGFSVEGAAAAIAARPLLGQLRLDQLEATAAELSLWVSTGGDGGALPLGLALQQLTAEPALAAEGSLPLISRCEALCSSLELSRTAALQYMMTQPRLMALDPRVIPSRVAAARRLVQLAAGRPAARAQAAVPSDVCGPPNAPTHQAHAPAPREGPPAPPPPSLLLCSGTRLAECLTLLQRLLGLSGPAAAAVLAAQPALALQAPAALAATVDFLSSRLPWSMASSAASASTAATAAAAPDVLEDKSRGRGQAQQEGGARNSGPVGWRKRQLARLPPPHIQLLTRRCPDLLLLEPQRAAAALEVLTGLLQDAVRHPQLEAAAAAAAAVHTGGGVPAERLLGEVAAAAAADRGRWAHRLAAHMVTRAPRLLLCRLIPPAWARRSGGGGGDGGGGSGGGESALSRDRQTTILGLAKAVDEAQCKRHVDAASLALDGPDWPRPIVALPYEYGVGAVAPDGGVGMAAASVLDGGGGVPRCNDTAAAAAAATASSEAALAAAAAAVGVCPIPIDVGLREAELLHVLRSEALPPLGQSAARVSGIGSGDGPGAAAPALAIAAVRSWLWCEVLAVEPRLLLLSSAQLAATVEALCAWLAVPAEALSSYLLPYELGAQRFLERGGGLVLTPSRGVAADAEEGASSGVPSVRRPQLPRNHAVLLVRRSDALHRAGYLVWNWLGGGDAASAADVAAVLRAMPGLLYDATTMRACGSVLCALLGDDGDGDGGTAHVTRPPDWAVITPPDDADPQDGIDLGPGRCASWQNHGSVSAMPAAAAALVLQFPGEVLAEEVLELLNTAPAASATAAPTVAVKDAAEKGRRVKSRAASGLPGAVIEGGGHSDGAAAASASTAASGNGGWRLRRVVARLTELLGVGRLAAAALVLATRGSVALQVEALPPDAAACVERAMSAIRRGGAWRRELRRYLYGSTSYSSPGRLCSENLEAVSVSCQELVVAVRGWQRVERLEALEAAGLQDAVSFATVLQLPDDEWRDLAQRLRLAQPSGRSTPTGT